MSSYLGYSCGLSFCIQKIFYALKYIFLIFSVDGGELWLSQRSDESCRPFLQIFVHTVIILQTFSWVLWTSWILFMGQARNSDSSKETPGLREVDKIWLWLISPVSRSLLMEGKKEFCPQTVYRLKLNTSWFYFLENLDWYRFSQRLLTLKLWQKGIWCPKCTLFPDSGSCACLCQGGR